MKTMIASALVATGLTMGAPVALAQSNSSDAMTAQPQAAATVSDAEVTAFAASAGEIQKVQADSSLEAADKQKQMVSILEKHSLTPQRFNEIAQAMQTDKALAMRIRTAMQANGTMSAG
tara:strand:- start:929 stop:1285 length:357 start_codon:yes stop_codon:yes gene_type:complete